MKLIFSEKDLNEAIRSYLINNMGMSMANKEMVVDYTTSRNTANKIGKTTASISIVEIDDDIVESQKSLDFSETEENNPEVSMETGIEEQEDDDSDESEIF